MARGRLARPCGAASSRTCKGSQCTAPPCQTKARAHQRTREESVNVRNDPVRFGSGRCRPPTDYRELDGVRASGHALVSGAHGSAARIAQRACREMFARITAQLFPYAFVHSMRMLCVRMVKVDGWVGGWVGG